MAVIRERVRQIEAGEATPIEGDQVKQEMRQLARQSVKYRYVAGSLRSLLKCVGY
jgi:hypothetical protein